MAFTTEQIAAAKLAAGFKSAPTAADIANANKRGLGIFASTYKKITTPATTGQNPAASTPPTLAEMKAPLTGPNPQSSPLYDPNNPTYTGPTGSPAPETAKTQTKDPLSREYQESIGNQYLGTKEGVTAAQRAGKNVQKIGNSYFIVNDKSFQTDPQFAGGQLSRAALTAKGYKYLGTMDGVKAAQKAGENVQQLGGSYYIAPKPMVASAKPPAPPAGKNSEAGPSKDNPFTAPSSSDGRLQQTALQMPDVAEFMNAVPPEQIDLVKEYADLRRSENMDTLEGDVNAINKQLSDLDAAYLQGNKNIEGNLAPMQVIRGEQGELEKQYLFKRDVLARDAANKAAVLQQKQGVIETMMNLTKQTYDIARQSYQDKFTQAMEVQKFFRSSMESDRNYNLQVENQRRDDARANLTTISNTLTESGQNWGQLSTAMKTGIRQLELQAGLPAGTMETFAKSIPGAKLLSTVNGVDAGGNDIISFVYADKNGNPGVVKTIKTGGKSKVPGSTSGGGDKTYTGEYTRNDGTIVKYFINPTTGERSEVVVGEKGPTALQQKQSQQYDLYRGRLEDKNDKFSISDLKAAASGGFIDKDVYGYLIAETANGTIKVPDVQWNEAEKGWQKLIPGQSNKKSKNK